MKSRILICGGREFKDKDLFLKTIEQCRPFFATPFCLIHGFARGADMMAHLWAFDEGCPVIAMPANWNFYDKPAGGIRNQWMIDWARPDLVIAFPGGLGTEDMMRRTRAAKIDLYHVKAG
jgi:hypothetical protein